MDPGKWYSPLEKGRCGGKGGSRCTWRVVSVDKVVQRACHVRVFGEAVQASRAGDLSCLEACGAPKGNVSSPCWLDCLYQAALGPDAGLTGGEVAGLSLDELKAAWLKPFLPEVEGGCPPQAQHEPQADPPLLATALDDTEARAQGRATLLRGAWAAASRRLAANRPSRPLDEAVAAARRARAARRKEKAALHRRPKPPSGSSTLPNIWRGGEADQA